MHDDPSCGRSVQGCYDDDCRDRRLLVHRGGAVLRALRYYRSTTRGRYAASDGSELRSLRCGYGDETVVVIPGVDDALFDFEQLPWFWAWYFRPLADPGRRVIVVGRPRKLAEGTSTAGLAATYADVIARHIGPAHVVGISMGGLIAQHLAASRPDLVERVVFAVTAPRVSAGGVALGQRLAELGEAGRWYRFATEANRIWFAGPLRALLAVLLAVAAPLLWLLGALPGGGRRARDFRISGEACRAHDGTALLASITAPSLVWGAAGDCLFPRASLEAMARSLPRAEVSIIEGAHAAFMQRRARFHSALDRFFALGPVPRGRETDVEVAIVGSGFSGLGMAIRLKQRGRGSFLVFEKGAAVGGTWRDNDYPGCSCDVPAHLYSFSFDPNPRWSRKYAPQSEIREYLERCTRKHGLDRHLRLRSEVTRVEWDEPSATWTVMLGDGSAVTARHVVFGIGALSRPAYPTIDGVDRFGGRVFHSAQWDHEYDLTGKRVAVVGTGASAIQIVPQIAKRASRVSVFQRTPPWVLPKPDRAFSRLEQWLFGAFRPLQSLYRFFLYSALELRVLGFVFHPKIMRAAAALGRHQIRRQIRDPALRRKVTPDYVPGCKRVLIANDYYPALARPNVDLVTERIDRATETGIVTADGKEHALDAIVYGTGFRVTDLLSPLGVIGRGGVNLNDVWKARMQAYLGTAISGFPNFYMLLGPNTALGHSSMIYMIESQIEMVLRAMRAIEVRGARSAHVTERAQTDFNAGLEPRLRRSIWASGCRSWYLDASGHNATVWPGFTFEFRMRTRAFDESAFEFDPAPAPPRERPVASTTLPEALEPPAYSDSYSPDPALSSGARREGTTP
jgi:cation diffusion facilitator CzcD-associated flavoprotein CzcO/pimeloyl-ACP methyl ester carboxylesterase